MNKLLRAATAASLLFCQGCLGPMDPNTIMRNSWNVPSSDVSVFDGSKNIRMSNVACSQVVLEFYQDEEKSKQNVVLVTAGTRSIENIGDGVSLLFNVDGKVHSFKSSSVVTEHDSISVGEPTFGFSQIPYSYKKYIIPESFIRKAAAAKILMAKMYLLNSSFLEGICTPVTLEQARRQAGQEAYITQASVDLMNGSAAIYGFREFVKMMDNAKW